MTHTEKGWAISHNAVLYHGWWRTRQEAIAADMRKYSWTWDECREYGDRVVKVTITWEE